MKFNQIFSLLSLTLMLFAVANPALAVETPIPTLYTDGAEPTLKSPAPKRMVINDTFQKNQWYLDAINAYEAWAVAPTSSPRDIIVAVVDGGFDDSHPDLKGSLWEDPDEPIDGKDNDADGYVDDANGWNYVNDSSDIRPVGNIDKDNGAWEHGTIVASLISARGNDNIGMAGMAWNVKIMPLVILDSNGSGGTDKLAQAIRYAVRHRADIINLSLEGDMQDQDVADAILEATAQGVLVVIAAGNGFDGIAHNFDDYEIFPACHPGAAGQSVLVVTGTNADGSKYDSANYGSCASLAAPGGEIFAARPTYDPDGNRTEVSGYGAWSGTSMSAPLVSGVAAMLKAKYPTWTGEQLAQRILDTAQPFNAEIDSFGMGVGVLDAYSAMVDADPIKYGTWNLFASTKDQAPTVWITDFNGNNLFTFPVGNSGDKRAIHTAFVRWDDDRYPEVIVTAEGDERGSWRVYRTDGVLVAAGRLAEDSEEPIQGGLYIATQDIHSSGWSDILFTEAGGNRAWLTTPQETKTDPITFEQGGTENGILAVGLERPLQSFVILTRGTTNSQLYLLNNWNLDEGTVIETEHPERLRMVGALTQDNRELLRFVQSGEPSYLMEKEGMIQILSKEEAEKITVWQWRQAPLGEKLDEMEGKLFYDTWPR
ncbi:MAG: S8 family serine peptidase [Patescibacteria group bacterium]|nr:S8 family serine peptidase [Patescibacteria group bacterium]